MNQVFFQIFSIDKCEIWSQITDQLNKHVNSFSLFAEQEVCAKEGNKGLVQKAAAPAMNLWPWFVCMHVNAQGFAPLFKNSGNRNRWPDSEGRLLLCKKNTVMVTPHSPFYMHQCCLGIIRKLLLIWTKKGKRRVRMSAQQSALVSGKMVDFQDCIPSNFA